MTPQGRPTPSGLDPRRRHCRNKVSPQPCLTPPSGPRFSPVNAGSRHMSSEPLHREPRPHVSFLGKPRSREKRARPPGVIQSPKASVDVEEDAVSG